MSTGIGITGNGQIQQNADKQQQLQMHYQQQFAKNQQAQIQKVRNISGTSSDPTKDLFWNYFDTNLTHFTHFSKNYSNNLLYKCRISHRHSNNNM